MSKRIDLTNQTFGEWTVLSYAGNSKWHCRCSCGVENGGRVMVGKYKVITLCGSTRFKDEFIDMQKRLTLEGNIVISVGLFGHSGDDKVQTDRIKEMLDDMHKRKIDLADEIFVINPGGYIGSNTRSEIDYAKANDKKVVYMEPLKEDG